MAIYFVLNFGVQRLKIGKNCVYLYVLKDM